MKTNEIHIESARPMRTRQSTRRRDGKISAGPVVLGLVCAVGVFALLWLLYAYG